jgi:type I restriction enzyme M protein
MNTSSIIFKVSSFCNTLRDDGVRYGDYIEQLTYLLFLKMADELSKPFIKRNYLRPAGVFCKKPHYNKKQNYA